MSPTSKVSLQSNDDGLELREVIKKKLSVASWVAKEADLLQQRKDCLSYLRKLGKRLRQPNQGGQISVITEQAELEAGLKPSLV